MPLATIGAYFMLLIDTSRSILVMPDVLHWLGISRIDRLVSMSNMKYNAIVQSGIDIVERIPIPDDLIPPDARVEIEAKKSAGYFTTGEVLDAERLADVKGRSLE